MPTSKIGDIMFQGAKLKELRANRGFSLADMVFELARVGFRTTRQTLNNWENEDTEPNASSLKVLADFFGVSVEFFYNGS